MYLLNCQKFLRWKKKNYFFSFWKVKFAGSSRGWPPRHHISLVLLYRLLVRRLRPQGGCVPTRERLAYTNRFQSELAVQSVDIGCGRLQATPRLVNAHVLCHLVAVGGVQLVHKCLLHSVFFFLWYSKNGFRIFLFFFKFWRHWIRRPIQHLLPPLIWTRRPQVYQAWNTRGCTIWSRWSLCHFPYLSLTFMWRRMWHKRPSQYWPPNWAPFSPTHARWASASCGIIRTWLRWLSWTKSKP